MTRSCEACLRKMCEVECIDIKQEPVSCQNLCVNKILFNVDYLQNNMLLAAEFVIFCVV